MNVEKQIDLINWKLFMERNDMHWSKMPKNDMDGAFTGNGLLGAICWENENSLKFEISRTDVYDHRNDYSNDGSTTQLFSRYRMPNGYLKIKYVGEPLEQSNLHLDLWNAEIIGDIHTSKGNIKMRSFTHTHDNIIIIDIKATGEEKNYSLEWVPTPAKSYRTINTPENYNPYPPQVYEVIDGVNISTQYMPEDKLYNTIGRGHGQYSTAWKKIVNADGSETVFISEGYSYPGESSKEEAVSNIMQAIQKGLPVLEESHRDWWHTNYQKSFVSVPDSQLEAFYWIQIYKMLSASRENKPVMDLAGPWYKTSNWPAIWNNLNIQLQYYPFYVSNHNEHAKPMLNYFYDNRVNLALNAGLGRDDAYTISTSSDLFARTSSSFNTAGDLPYALNNLWQHYRYTMDDTMLKEKILPLLKGSFRYLQAHLSMTPADGSEPDGKLHIPKSWSPEWVNAEHKACYTYDTNYTLALIRWECTVIIEAIERLGLKDEITDECKYVLDNLTPYSYDKETGFMIGKDTVFDLSHRHWSHLFMIYPLFEYTYDNPEQIEAVDISVRNYLKDESRFCAYSYGGASSINAIRGNGNEAYRLLQLLMNNFRIQPNTFYFEGDNWPVIETPLMGARSLQDMMIMTYNNIIRIFPAIPDKWKETVFENFRAEGAFLVSAKRTNGKTQFIRIESLAGEPCKVKTDLTGKISCYGSKEFILNIADNGVICIENMEKGDWIVLYEGDAKPDTEILPVAITESANFWGCK